MFPFHSVKTHEWNEMVPFSYVQMYKTESASLQGALCPTSLPMISRHPRKRNRQKNDAARYRADKQVLSRLQQLGNAYQGEEDDGDNGRPANDEPGAKVGGKHSIQLTPSKCHAHVGVHPAYPLGGDC